MNNNEPTPDQIANAISTVADAAIRLKEADILSDDNVEKANEVLSTLLDKAMECIQKCMNCDCNDNPDNGGGDGGGQKDYVQEAWQQLGEQYGFTEDYCANLSLLQGMSGETMRDLVKNILYIQDMNPSTGQVSGNYTTQLEEIETNATESGDYDGYLLGYLTEVLNNTMGGNPSDCNPSDQNTYTEADKKG